MEYRGEISSLGNRHLAYVKSLQRKRVRLREERFLIEGLRLVRTALEDGVQPALAFCTSVFAESPEGASLVAEALAAEWPLWLVTDEVMAAMSDTLTPQGVVAVVPLKAGDPARLLQAPLILVLDAIRDPGNMGTILRTSRAAGLPGVLLVPGCVDPFSPKVVRAAMGAHFAMDLCSGVAWDEVASLCEGRRRVAADAHGVVSAWDYDWSQPTALVIGNEAHGLSQEARAWVDTLLALPMARGAESLNAGVACGVFLFEAIRQLGKPFEVSRP